MAAFLRAMRENRKKISYPAPVRCGENVLRFDKGPIIMGIVNTTPDSFSDGGEFLDPSRAIEHGLSMVEAGAQIVDIGGESTRPGSEPVSVGQESDRVLPVIEGIAKFATVAISIDTTKSQVAKLALDSGASIINDVSACRFDRGMIPLAAKTGCGVILMHMRGKPKTMQKGEIVYDDLIGEITDQLATSSAKLMDAGLPREKIMWDPGIGFGKALVHNLMIINRLDQLSEHGFAIVLGPSRKSFIGKILDKPVQQRMFGTAAAICAGVSNGAHILRVHDVAQMHDVAMVAAAIRDEAIPGGTRRI